MIDCFACLALLLVAFYCTLEEVDIEDISPSLPACEEDHTDTMEDFMRPKDTISAEEKESNNAVVQSGKDTSRATFAYWSS